MINISRIGKDNFIINIKINIRNQNTKIFKKITLDSPEIR